MDDQKGGEKGKEKKKKREEEKKMKEKRNNPPPLQSLSGPPFAFHTLAVAVQPLYIKNAISSIPLPAPLCPPVNITLPHSTSLTYVAVGGPRPPPPPPQQKQIQHRIQNEIIIT